MRSSSAPGLGLPALSDAAGSSWQSGPPLATPALPGPIGSATSRMRVSGPSRFSSTAFGAAGLPSRYGTSQVAPAPSGLPVGFVESVAVLTSPGFSFMDLGTIFNPAR